MYLVGPYDQTVIAGLALREVWDEPLLGKIEANPELRGVRVQTLDEALEFASLWAGAAARLFERSPGWHAAQELPRLGGGISAKCETFGRPRSKKKPLTADGSAPLFVSTTRVSNYSVKSCLSGTTPGIRYRQRGVLTGSWAQQTPWANTSAFTEGNPCTTSTSPKTG